MSASTEILRTRKLWLNHFLSLSALIFCSDLPTTLANEGVVLDEMVGYVNTQPILLSDIEKFHQVMGLRGQIDPLYAHSELQKKGHAVSQEEVVDTIINNQLIEAEFPKSDVEVEQEITNIQTNNRISRTTLKEALEREGYFFSDYFELIREAASKKELVGREIQTKVAITDDDVKNYYLNHLPKGSKSQRAFHIQLITIQSKNYKSPAAATQVAQDALKKIKSGESFEEVARRVSDDPSASLGGDLGFVHDDQVMPLIANALKNLQIGQVSDIFSDGSGRQLILKLVDVRSTEIEQLEKMKEEIRSQLMSKEIEQQIKLWVERKRQSAVVQNQKSPVSPTK